MSTNIELTVLGKVLRLNCPTEKQNELKAAAQEFENRVTELKDRTGILNQEKILTIIGLNLAYELMQQKITNANYNNELQNRAAQIDTLLTQALIKKPIV